MASSETLIFQLHLNQTSLAFKPEDIPLTFDEGTRKFFTAFIFKTNGTFQDIRENYLEEKNSNMPILCCLLSCTIIGIIPCCCYMNSSFKKKKEMNGRLHERLHKATTDLMNTLKDFDGLVLLKQKKDEKDNDDSTNWKWYFDIKCRSLEHKSVPFTGSSGVNVVGTELNMNGIHFEMNTGTVSNQDMMGGVGYSSAMVNMQIGSNYPPPENIINNQVNPEPPK